MKGLSLLAQAGIKLFGGWASITEQVDQWAVANGKPTYSVASTKYRFSGFGTVGFPPKIAFNVTYIDGLTVETADLGRIVAR